MIFDCRKEGEINRRLDNDAVAGVSESQSAQI